MNKKVISSIGILSICVISILLLWKQPEILTFFLLCLAYAKYKFFPIKKEFLWFTMLSIGGAVTEIILVNVANAWTYANPQILGIPIYMPVFWGVIGTTIIVAYDGLINST